jgi:Ser/Thr protein kinase RdoA (MazF antagonist)
MMASQHVPVTRSILAAEALIPLIQKTYALNVKSCRLIKAFILHTYHIITDDDQYIFRVYPHRRRTKTAVMAELELLNYLRASGVSVSVPLATKEDQLLLTLIAPEGERLAALFTYAPGTPLSETSDMKNIHAYGGTLATIHQQTDAMPLALERPSLDFDRLITEPIERLAVTFPQRHHDWAYLREITPQLRHVIEAVAKEPSYYGLCHGDASSTNAHVTPGGQLTLFDFDFCGLGWRAYDVGTFLIDTSAKIAISFLSGYQEICALSDAEMAALPAFQAAQNIWLLGLRASYVNEWGLAFFSDHFVDGVLHNIKRYMTDINGKSR